MMADSNSKFVSLIRDKIN